MLSYATFSDTISLNFIDLVQFKHIPKIVVERKAQTPTQN